jgi:hypothetical protein
VSHIVQSKTAIQNPNGALLRQAVELVAQQRQGRLGDTYQDYYRHLKHPSTGLALFTPTLHRGIGLDLDQQGTLIFTGDPWGVQQEFDQVQQEIIQSYVSLATMNVLAQMGYTAQAEDLGQGKIAIRGTIYA